MVCLLEERILLPSRVSRAKCPPPKFNEYMFQAQRMLFEYAEKLRESFPKELKLDDRNKDRLFQYVAVIFSDPEGPVGKSTYTSDDGSKKKRTGTLWDANFKGYTQSVPTKHLVPIAGGYLSYILVQICLPSHNVLDEYNYVENTNDHTDAVFSHLIKHIGKIGFLRMIEVLYHARIYGNYTWEQFDKSEPESISEKLLCHHVDGAVKIIAECIASSIVWTPQICEKMPLFWCTIMSPHKFFTALLILQVTPMDYLKMQKNPMQMSSFSPQFGSWQKPLKYSIPKKQCSTQIQMEVVH